MPLCSVIFQNIYLSNLIIHILNFGNLTWIYTKSTRGNLQLRIIGLVTVIGVEMLNLVDINGE